MLVGAGLVVTSFALGRFSPAHRSPSAPQIPACGCKHVLSYHDPKTGECKYHDSPYEWERCACRQYTGPKPLDPGYYAPDIL